jgi:hypothetical protein
MIRSVREFGVLIWRAANWDKCKGEFITRKTGLTLFLLFFARKL